MKNPILFLVALAFLSCSTTKTSRKISSQDNDGLNFSNEDFESIPKIKFRITTDIFTDVSAGKDVLAEESLVRVPKSKLLLASGKNDVLSRAIALCYMKKYNQALELLKKNYRRYKKHAGFWNNAGTCHFLRGNLRKALLYYNKSKELSPEYAPPVNNLGVIYERKNKDERALIAYTKAAKLGRFSQTPIYNQGQLYLKYGFAKKANSIFSALYNKKPKDSTTASALATSHLLLGELEKAISIFKNIDKNALRNAHIGMNFAVALKIKGQTQEAKRVLSNIHKIRRQERKHYKKVKNYVEN